MSLIKLNMKIFFSSNRKEYNRAKNAYKYVKIKMGGQADIDLLYNITKKNKTKRNS